MVKGLVLGKFHPLHVGHIGLIDFAQKQCDELIVLICASDKESISGSTRLEWLQETFKSNLRIKPTLFSYNEKDLPNTSVASKEVSKVWATAIKTFLPRIDIVFSSEPYGDYLAQFLKCNHIPFEPGRTTFNISASEINRNVYMLWQYLANAAKPFFVKKISINGTESTGKSTLTERLAGYFQTEFVPEMARDIIEKTGECTEQHLIQVATLQAKKINEKVKTANKFLFVDTDLNTTFSYSKYLFNKKLVVESWIEKANQFHLYLYLDNDVAHIQDGTRLDKQRRDELNDYHKNELAGNGIKFELINGNWDERFEKSVSIIKRLWR